MADKRCLRRMLRSMRIVVAPQEFKGSLTAVEAARAMAAGLHAFAPDVTVDEAAVSDGGAGLVDALIAGLSGECRSVAVHDPLMRPVTATWGLLADGRGVIEMAAASGLVLVDAQDRDPLRTSTYGTGELIHAALDAGCREVLVGVGGSATVDAGAGAMQALGARLLDANGHDLPRGGAALTRLDRIETSGVDVRLAGVTLRVACDVRNPLYGPEGAARIFAPQKGASPADIDLLDAALHRFAEVVERDAGVRLNEIEGTGAAGGLGAGLLVAAGARIEPGFPIVAEAIDLRKRIEAADLVITGEGRLDSQTSYGKAADGVAAIARSCGKRVFAIAGSITDYDPQAGTFDGVIASTPREMAVDEAMRAGATLVSSAAERLLREVLAS